MPVIPDIGARRICYHASRVAAALCAPACHYVVYHTLPVSTLELEL